MFGFMSKKKLQERAEELIISANVAARSANKTEFFDLFMDDYDEILLCFEELTDISHKIELKNISGDPEIDFLNLKNDKQWHMRDALERNADKIIREGTTTYRNNSRKNEASYENFKECIENYDAVFDEETRDFAKRLLQKLRLKFKISFEEEEKTDNLEISNSMDKLEGHDFEHFCALLLKSNGFKNVEVTQGSGDQGVDIVAEKDEIRYAIQCKCYSSNLGNKPVQEVYAGKNMYNCHIGVVMTNRYFTKGAQDLAATNGVLLWDRDKLLHLLENSK